MTAPTFLIPFGDRFLALDAATFAAALERGRAAVPAKVAEPMPVIIPHPLVDVTALAREINVAVSQVRELVRRKQIPVVRVGRHHRFDVEEVKAALKDARVSSDEQRA